jgi:hypothetical protein
MVGKTPSAIAASPQGLCLFGINSWISNGYKVCTDPAHALRTVPPITMLMDVAFAHIMEPMMPSSWPPMIK